MTKMNQKHPRNQPFKRLEIAKQILKDPDNEFENLVVWNGTLFDGLSTDPKTQEISGIFGGSLYFKICPYGKMHAISFYSCNQLENGYIFNGTQFQTNHFGLGRMSENTDEANYWACLRPFVLLRQSMWAMI
jgi:hypothetical protein